MLRIAVSQLQMSDTIEENHRSIRAALEEAVIRGASLVLFPECAITGFHRGLAQLYSPPALQTVVADLQQRVDEHGCAVVVGSPWPGQDEQRLNAALIIRPGVSMVVAPKVGLTASEAQFFSAGERQRLS